MYKKYRLTTAFIALIVAVLMPGLVQAENISTNPEALQYDLPLSTEEIYNYENFSSKISLSEDALAQLEKNGFVVVQDPFCPEEEDITKPYDQLKSIQVPVFITSDSLLHLYHIQFDETLKTIEEEHFYDDLWSICNVMLAKSEEDYNISVGDAKEAARRNMAFFSVGLKLLQPREDQSSQEIEWVSDDQLSQGKEWLNQLFSHELTFEGDTTSYFSSEDVEQYQFDVPLPVQDEVEKELTLIGNHSGFGTSPIFEYDEDYSQYVPRGHYTSSEKLKNYFQAMMWFGRMAFLLKGCEDGNECIVSEKTATIQTIGACMISQNLDDDPDSMKLWDRIYNVTSFYVGYSDDLGPYEYSDDFNYVFGETFQANNMTKEDVEKLKTVLALRRTPEIYGGSGVNADVCVVDLPVSLEQADKCLAATAGFRFMGQKFIPDSYIFQNLVFPYPGEYTGNATAFTQGPFGRHFPRGLDVMALLGSDRALALLTELNDSSYADYDAQYTKLEEEFESFDEEDWQKNLYWSWLYSLKPLIQQPGPKCPTFMQTTAWQDKGLTTSLASWTELRHDTILYAKQSYTRYGKSLTPISVTPIKENTVQGYVEPVPEFYERLLALTRMTSQNLDEMGLLDYSSSYSLDQLESILTSLMRISAAELEGQELSDEDLEFIKDFGNLVDDVVLDVDEDSKKTTIVADVHTDSNSGQVLEEGVGYVRLVIVAYKVPDGGIFLGAGPIFSYYEFKQPMSQRLTDESWRDMLVRDPPANPEWVLYF